MAMLHKLCAFSVALTSLLVVACVPYATSYRHVYFEDRPGMVVYQRYTGGDDPTALLFARHDVPLKTRVSGNRYTVEILTPLSTGEPLAFLRAFDSGGATLILKGPNLLPLEKTAGIYVLEGYHYSFLVEDARGDPLRVQIEDGRGDVLGSETLPYRVRSRGRFYGIARP
jgi:hypothetical protein